MLTLYDVQRNHDFIHQFHVFDLQNENNDEMKWNETREAGEAGEAGGAGEEEEEEKKMRSADDSWATCTLCRLHFSRMQQMHYLIRFPRSRSFGIQCTRRVR